ncbi:MAG: N-glycosylase/DNA lyase [archaeon]|jgi:N-glycosylase/DNA lyase
MNSLIQKVIELKKSPVSKIIFKKIKTFKGFQKKSSNDIFKELCFCLMTANFNAKRAVEIQEKVDNGFLNFSEEKLAKILKQYGHRFPNKRAHFIAKAQEHKTTIKEELFSIKDKYEKREWLVKSIKGLGFKESSHFLRNIGFLDYAIIDFHIVDILVDNKIIKRPKTLNKENYLLVEQKLEKFSKKTNLSLGELDFYLWYLETGVIYK